MHGEKSESGDVLREFYISCIQLFYSLQRSPNKAIYFIILTLFSNEELDESRKRDHPIILNTFTSLSFQDFYQSLNSKFM